MPATAVASLAYCLAYLRRKYLVADLAALKTLADEVFATATDEVTINSVSYEGGSAGGQIKFDKIILGQALEQRIAELDPEYVAPVLTPMGRPWGVTVRLGC